MSMALEKRLAILEMRPAKRNLGDQATWEEQTLIDLCMTRDQFMAEYGGFPNYAYLKMKTPDGSPAEALPTKYKSWGDYYFAMINKVVE